jgi:succinoglycan biosynthesis protein ExoV
MDLFYWKSPQGNFGDDLNEWLWDELLPGWRGWDPGLTLVGVGTVYNDVHFPQTRPGRFVVLGSGVGYGAPPSADVLARSDIRALRGPRSARLLNLPETTGIIDPAMMIATLDAFQGIARSGRPIFVPHVSSVGLYPWAQICAGVGVEYVSPCGDAREVIGRIAGASLVIAESMHAVILADAFRVPWRSVRLSRSFNTDKWMDWGDSLQITPEVLPLVPALDRLLALRRPKAGAKPAQKPAGTAAARPPSFKRRLRLGLERMLLPQGLTAQLSLPPQLSSAARLEARRDRYREMLEAVCRDYG